MKHKILICLVVTVICGCTVQYYSYSNRSFDHDAKKRIDVTSPLSPGGAVFTDLTHMDITVIGQGTDQCAVAAELSVSATSQEIADAVAEQLVVKLVQQKDRLEVVLQKPSEYTDDYSVGGKMTITVPLQTRLDLTTTYGTCRIEQIQSDVNIRSTHGGLSLDGLTGQIIAKTTYGDVTVDRTKTASAQVTTSHAQIRLSDCTIPQIHCETTYGDIRLTKTSAEKMDLSTTHSAIELTECTAKEATLNTSYGQIRGKVCQIERITARTSHAPIDLRCVNETSPNIAATLNTTYGDIEFCPPAGFSGKVSIATSYGKIRSDMPMMVQGVINENSFTGQVGPGTGDIQLTTTHSDVHLKNP